MHTGRHTDGWCGALRAKRCQVYFPNALSQVTDFTAVGSSALTSQDFTYDANGNRTSITQNSTTYNYTITTNSNRLSSTQGPTAKTMTYDASGNITDDDVNTYVYDDWGRLESVNSSAVTYDYNGQGQRVTKDDGTDKTLFVYNEFGNLIGEYDDTGSIIQEHIWFAGAPVAVTDGTDYYYVHTDHLGTPRIVTDGNTALWRWESGPFGEEAPDEDVDGDSTDFTYNLRFPGQYYDSETDIHYNYFRDYDPSPGRYRESDLIGMVGGTNTYSFAKNLPTRYVDPYGLIDWDVVMNGGVGTIVFGAAGFEIVLTTAECIDGQKAQVTVLLAGFAAGAGAKYQYPFSPTEGSHFKMSDKYDYINLANMSGVMAINQAGAGIGYGYSCFRLGFGDASDLDTGVVGGKCGFGKTIFDFGISSALGSATVTDVQFKKCNTCKDSNNEGEEAQ